MQDKLLTRGGAQNAVKIAPQRWLPFRWDEIVGCHDLVEQYQAVLRDMQQGNLNGMNTYVIGPSRTGKTAITKQFCRCATCEKLDPDTLNPCPRSAPDKCYGCRTDVSTLGDMGLFTDLRGQRVHFLPIDCTSMTPGRLTEILADLREYEGTRIVYFDEVHRLSRHCMDEKLLKPVEERNFMWIASSITTQGMDHALLNRFVSVRTQLPSLEELSLWIAARCHDFGVEWDESDTIVQLAQRSGRSPGKALQVLASAYATPSKVLGRRLVEKFIFLAAE